MEILFRGKWTYNGEWVYGTPIYEGDSVYILSGVIEANEEYICIEDWRLVVPETVGQYTGHSDRNGKRIFVGDFVLVKDGLRYGDNYECVGTILVEDIRTVGLEDYEELTVIGNIHDNPELLDG